MEPINLKIFPIAILAVILSYFTFASAASLISNIEIIITFEAVLAFLFVFIILLSLTSILISLTLALVSNLYYRMALFGLVFLPFASIFILSLQVEPMFMLIFFILFIAMAATMIIEFDRHYANQIKAHLGIPARSSIKTIAFFLALTTALAFFNVNNNATYQKEIADKIVNEVVTSTAKAINDYDLADKMMGQTNMEQIGQVVPKANIQKQLDSYIKNQINTMVDPYRPYIVYILTVLLFGTIIGTASFASFVTTLLLMALLPTLKSSGYIKESSQMVEVKRLTL